MIADRIKYTKEFSHHGISEWLGVEGTLEPGESVLEGLSKAREKVIEAYKQSFKEETPIVQRSPIDQIEEDFKFNEVKKALANFEYREDAQAYLDTTEYSYTIEAKKIVNAKPIKTK